MRLWYDGFRWSIFPFRLLNEVVARHFSNYEPRVAEVFAGAVATLLDNGKSGIIVFLHNDDERVLADSINKSHMVRMRDGMESPKFPWTVKQLPSSALGGILQIDGAHVIDQEGHLVYQALNVALQIAEFEFDPVESTRIDQWIDKQPGKPCYLMRQENRLIIEGQLRRSQIEQLQPLGIGGSLVQDLSKYYDEGESDIDLEAGILSRPTPRGNATGTGRRAAQNLSLLLPHSFVLKVSASGALKFFHKGRPMSDADG
jgi:hypothetical protein